MASASSHMTISTLLAESMESPSRACRTRACSCKCLVESGSSTARVLSRATWARIQATGIAYSYMTSSLCQAGCTASPKPSTARRGSACTRRCSDSSVSEVNVYPAREEVS
eukprot:scaffold3166_cov399-Prasinococcus_capsulatus_cf.AAC.8